MSTVHTVFLVLSGGLAVVILLIAGSGKITGKSAMRESAEHFGIPWAYYRSIGFVEIVAAVLVVVGFWSHGLGLATGVVLLGILAGAVAFHLRAGDTVKSMVPAIVAVVLVGGYTFAQLMAL